MTDIEKRRGATFATLITLIALVTLAAALAGCAVGPNYVKPATTVAPQFAGTTQGAFSPEDAQARFWTQFGDNVVRGFRILAKDQPKDAGG